MFLHGIIPNQKSWPIKSTTTKGINMTVKELIEKLKEFDGNLKVGGSGHYGEILKIDDVYLNKYRSQKFVEITIQSAGPEPD
jgi:hypothetical protein